MSLNCEYKRSQSEKPPYPYNVESLVEFYLGMLSELEVPLPNGNSVQVIENLKQRPRSGILVRNNASGLALPIQSIYSHVISCGTNADILISTACNKPILALLISYHDLSESIIGDVPSFTNSQLADKTFLTEEQKRKQEQMANLAIAQKLPPYLITPFLSAIHEIDENNTELAHLFNMLDKTEPIISIWRYIYAFRNRIDINTFISAMSDFFTNPNVISCTELTDIQNFIRFLQNPQNAREYYTNGVHVFSQIQLATISETDLRSLIEEKPMHFVSPPETNKQ